MIEGIELRRPEADRKEVVRDEIFVPLPRVRSYYFIELDIICPIKITTALIVRHPH